MIRALALLCTCQLAGEVAVRGFAVGLAAHGIGTARAFTVDPVASTFAGIAMGVNALLTALLVPIAVRLAGLAP